MHFCLTSRFTDKLVPNLFLVVLGLLTPLDVSGNEEVLNSGSVFPLKSEKYHITAFVLHILQMLSAAPLRSIMMVIRHL
ncbi:hypothetical protein C8R45DRAFT_1008676 [Mycena sanguinolenta]|nr:hypothetical protein C8R45DRAFT_1008676 [Mycena sanguinolenta]